MCVKCYGDIDFLRTSMHSHPGLDNDKLTPLIGGGLFRLSAPVDRNLVLSTLRTECVAMCKTHLRCEGHKVAPEKLSVSSDSSLKKCFLL